MIESEAIDLGEPTEKEMEGGGELDLEALEDDGDTLDLDSVDGGDEGLDLDSLEEGDDEPDLGESEGEPQADPGR
jgi:hypothetical protein